MNARTRELITSSKSVEHYTPTWIVNLCEEMFGGIVELDPASNFANPNVFALRHFDFIDDGLAQPWKARTVYVNPPYGRGLGAWVAKFFAEYRAGHFRMGAMLLPARTGTRWWDTLDGWPVLLFNHRITFVGSKDPSLFDSALLVAGIDWVRLARVFGGHGRVWYALPKLGEGRTHHRERIKSA